MRCLSLIAALIVLNGCSKTVENTGASDSNSSTSSGSTDSGSSGTGEQKDQKPSDEEEREKERIENERKTEEAKKAAEAEAEAERRAYENEVQKRVNIAAGYQFYANEVYKTYKAFYVEKEVQGQLFIIRRLIGIQLLIAKHLLQDNSVNVDNIKEGIKELNDPGLTFDFVNEKVKSLNLNKEQVSAFTSEFTAVNKPINDMKDTFYQTLGNLQFYLDNFGQKTLEEMNESLAKMKPLAIKLDELNKQFADDEHSSYVNQLVRIGNALGIKEQIYVHYQPLNDGLK